MDPSAVARLVAGFHVPILVGEHLHPDLGVGRDVERGLHLGLAAPAVGTRRDRPRPQERPGSDPRDPGVRLLQEPHRGTVAEDRFTDRMDQDLQSLRRLAGPPPGGIRGPASRGLGPVAGGEAFRECAVNLDLHALSPPDVRRIARCARLRRKGPVRRPAERRGAGRWRVPPSASYSPCSDVYRRRAGARARRGDRPGRGRTTLLPRNRPGAAPSRSDGIRRFDRNDRGCRMKSGNFRRIGESALWSRILRT